MSLSSVSVPIENSEEFEEITKVKLRSFIYLPKEGLQGEDIPSHILWENAKAEHIRVSFRPPLKCKDVFNVKDYEVKDNEITIKRLEMEGYIGLLFESSKVSKLDVLVPVKYLVYLSNGKMIEDVREIRLFKPQLNVSVPEKLEVKIDSKTGFVRGRIGIRNVGRGTLLLAITATEDSPIELVTPPEHREFAEKFVSDLLKELSKLATGFPHFQPILDETIEWEKKDLMEISDKERDKYVQYINRLANTLAGDKNLLQGFVEAYAKAAAKHSEFIEAVKKFVRIYESMVSRDMLLINPLDDLVLQEGGDKVILKISQTDKVLDEYEDIQLPEIRIVSSGPIKVPIYKLFDWS